MMKAISGCAEVQEWVERVAQLQAALDIETSHDHTPEVVAEIVGPTEAAAQGWLKQVAQIQAILDEGQGAATKIICPLPASGEMAKDVDDCEATRLTHSLNQLAMSASGLLDQLQRICKLF